MLRFQRLSPPLVLLLILAGLTLPATTARASDPLRLALAPVAEDCARWLQSRRQSVAVLRVNGPATDSTVTSAPGIRAILEEELRTRNIEVKARASYGIRVSFQGLSIPDTQNRDRKRLRVELSVSILDERENAVEDLRHRIENEDAVRIILCLCNDRQGDYSAAGDGQLLASFFQPKAHLDGTAVLAGEKSPFAVELVVADKAVQPVAKEGQASVPGTREQEYAIRLINRSPQEMAVRLSVDGLNVFHFSELKQPVTLPDGKPNPRKGESLFDVIFVPARSEVLVPGWHRTNEKVLAFKVTEYAQTAAAQFGKDDASVGTITAAFMAAWEKEPPQDEAPIARGPGDDGTGFGRPIGVETKPVQRTIGRVRASVSVRYAVPAQP